MFILEIIALVSSATAATRYVYKTVTDIRENRYAATFVTQNRMNQNDRGIFNEVVIPKRRVIPGHTHGQAAASRSAASAAACAYAYRVGKRPFVVAMSAADQRAGKEGNRIMHWSKDFNAEAKIMEPHSDSLLIMIDVDEHMDTLPKYLHDQFKSAVLYTFQPSVASGTFDNYKFTFNKDNEVIFEVDGGGKYVHPVWDYSPDCLTMRKKFLGLTYAKSFFTVEKRYVDENHQLILLTPLAKFGLLGCIFSYRVKGDDLQRLKPVKDGQIVINVDRSSVNGAAHKHLRSTARILTYNAATIPVESDDALAAHSRTGTSALSNFTVKANNKDISPEASITLVEHHRKKLVIAPPRMIIPSDAVNNYTYNPSPFTEEKPAQIPFMCPLFPDTYVPTCSVENDNAMVNGRILKLRQPVDCLDEKFKQYAYEFANLLKDDAGGCLIPVDHEEIIARLSRPTQVRITEEASTLTRVSTLVKSFMKKEAYQKPTDPRPIATINGKDKYEYSAFMYAVAEALKKTKWYAFGKTPVEIATAVSDLCAQAKRVTKTDLSRFDGRLNKSTREFEEIVMRVLFFERYHTDMLTSMKTQYGSKAVTALGVLYQNSFNRLSGSPETANFNSLLNKFMKYCTLRESGMTPKQAYDSPGLYGGDDGLTADVNEGLYVSTCAKFGHVLEAETIERGKKGIDFLARIYSPDVWEGSLSSCADIARALSKFHVTTTNSMSPLDKLFEKSVALYYSDKNTPIIGAFVSRVVALSNKPIGEFKNNLRIWNADIEESSQYPNEIDDNWMHEILVDQHLDGFQLAAFDFWLVSCNSMEQLLHAPQFIDTPDLKQADVEIKINDELIPAAVTVKTEDMKSPADEVPTTAFVKPPRPVKPAGMTWREFRTQLYLKRKEDAPVVSPPPKIIVSNAPGLSNPTNDTTTFAPNLSIMANVTRPAAPLRRGPISGGRRKSVFRPSDKSGTVSSSSGVKTCLEPACESDVATRPLGRPWNTIVQAGVGGITAPVPSPRLVGIETNPGPSVLDSIRNAAYRAWNDDHHPAEAHPFGQGGRITDNLFHQGLMEPFDSTYDAMEGYTPQSVKDFVNESVEAIGALNGESRGDISKDVRSMANLVAQRSQINGNNGSATNTDDHSAKMPTLKKLANAISKAEQKSQSRLVNKQNPRKQKQQQRRPPMVSAPVAATRENVTGAPKYKRVSKDSMTIEHSEMVYLVTGTTGFSAVSLPMQPGLSSVFRWLSTQTVGWEQYRWRKLRVRYETRTGTNVPGSVILCADYDATDSAPSSQFDASSYHGTKDDAPWKEIVFDLNMARSHPLYLRSGPLTANQDIKLNDFANLFVCTTDGTAVSWGKVFIDYEIELITSQIVSNSLTTGGTIVDNAGAGCTAANIFGTSAIVTPGSYVSSVSGAGYITLTNLVIGAAYTVSVSVFGTTITAITNTHAGFTVRSYIHNDLINGAANTAIELGTFTANQTSGSFTITATAATVTGAKFIFTPVTTASPF